MLNRTAVLIALLVSFMALPMVSTHANVDRMMNILEEDQLDEFERQQEDEEEGELGSGDIGTRRLLREPEPHYWFNLRVSSRGITTDNANYLPDPFRRRGKYWSNSIRLTHQPKLEGLPEAFNGNFFVAYSRADYEDDLNSFDYSTVSGGLNLSYGVFSNGSLFSTLQLQDVVNGTNPSSDDTSQRKVVLNTGYRHMLPITRRQNLMLGVSGAFEESRKVSGSAEPGDSTDSERNTYSAFANYYYQAMRRLRLSFSARFDYQDYQFQGAPFVISTGDTRHDRVWNLSTRATYRLTQGFDLNLGVSFADRESNQNVSLTSVERDHQQWRISAGVTYRLPFLGTTP